jgi:PAT family beta-lactamase induction signal transducer AmpG
MSDFLKIFSSYKLFEVCILGLFSGMPLAVLSVNCLLTWLKEDNIALEVVTTFAIAKTAHSLKFLWSPIIDYFRVPFFGHFGLRRSWLLICSMAITAILFCMSQLKPHESLASIYWLAIVLGFFSATFDIAFDAFRIDSLSSELQGVGAANTVLGYRIGMLIAGAGALEIAHIYQSWEIAFIAIACVYSLSVIIILLSKEPEIKRDNNNKIDISFLKKGGIDPCLDFLKRDFAAVTLIAIILFKIGDALLAVVSVPFYLELGYDKHQIFLVTKVYGVVATILGSYAGGLLIDRLGQFKGMIISGLAQAVTNLSFVWLNHQGGDISALFIAISLDNFTGGMGSAALVAFLSLLCNKHYSATQYAFLSSAATLCNNTITIFCGKMVVSLGWDYFFVLTVVLSIPGILLLTYLHSKSKSA